MQSTSYIPTDTGRLQLSWKTHKSFPLFLKPLFNKPKTLTFCHSLRTSYEEINNEELSTAYHLPIKIKKAGKASQYFWNGRHLQLVSIGENTSNQPNLDDGFDKFYKYCSSAFRELLIPNQVRGNYVEYVKWKCLHRVFSSALQVLATQAMFQAMGFGFSRSLSSAAAVNWVLKDGLGKLSRCLYTNCLASAFDTNLKRVRFSTSIMFSLSIGIELLTPFFPHLFLLIATMANIAKQISLACYLSTRAAVHRSFAVAGNIGEISAKAQIQTVCFDSLGLILAALLNILCKNNHRFQAALPLAVYPLFSAIDLLGIYQGLKHVHLQTLTKDRLEIILDTWICLRSIPSPAKVSKEESIDFPWHKGRKRWPIRIGCINPEDSISKYFMLTMRALRSEDKYFICMESSKRGFTGSWQEGILLCLCEDADTPHIIMGLLQACYIRRMLVEEKEKWDHIIPEASDLSESVLREWFDLVDDSKKCVDRDAIIESKKGAERKANLLTEMKAAGWAHENILLSAQEQVKYSFLGD